MISLEPDYSPDSFLHHSGKLEVPSLKPNSNPDDVYISLVDFAPQISALKVHIHPKTGAGLAMRSHNACFMTDIKKEVSSVLANIRSPVQSSHIRHLEAQKAKLDGAFGGSRFCKSPQGRF
jgi:hypothetical protein